MQSALQALARFAVGFGVLIYSALAATALTPAPPTAGLTSAVAAATLLVVLPPLAYVARRDPSMRRVTGFAVGVGVSCVALSAGTGTLPWATYERLGEVAALSPVATYATVTAVVAALGVAVTGVVLYRNALWESATS